MFPSSSYSFICIGHDLPMHNVPFPVYPGLQMQSKDPSVLLQKALAPQLSTLVVHSLISERQKRPDVICVNTECWHYFYTTVWCS